MTKKHKRGRPLLRLDPAERALEDRVQAAYDLCDLRNQHKWERIAAMVGIPVAECKAIYLRLRNRREYRGLSDARKSSEDLGVDAAKQKDGRADEERRSVGESNHAPRG